MKNSISFFMVLSLFAGTLFGQDQNVVSSAGNYFETLSGSISFTIGECMTTTLQSDDLILSQGFQQAEIILIENLTGRSDILIEAYPNPAAAFVIIEMEDPLPCSFRLTDMTGSIVKQGMIESLQSEIDLTELKASLYILQLYKNDEEIKSFKIIKR